MYSDERRLEQPRAADEAECEVLDRESLPCAVLTLEALADLRPEHAAAHERAGEEVVRTREACEVDYPDSVDWEE